MAIFINYRRDDSSAIAGRIDDHLRRAFGRRAVYRDIDSIPLGMPFADHIRTEVSRCRVFLVIVGKHWVSARLHDAEDFVRLEIEAALERSIPVIPVLVEGAPLPKEAELPASLRPLLKRQGLPVDSGSDFHLHMERLIKGVQLLLVATPRPRAPLTLQSLGEAWQASTTALAAVYARLRRWGLLAVAVAGLGAVLAWRLWDEHTTRVLALNDRGKTELAIPPAGGDAGTNQPGSPEEPVPSGTDAVGAGATGNSVADDALEREGSGDRASGGRGSAEAGKLPVRDLPAPRNRRTKEQPAPSLPAGGTEENTSPSGAQPAGGTATNGLAAHPASGAASETSCGTLEDAGFAAGSCLVAGEACPQWYTLHADGGGPMQLRALAETGPGQRGCALKAQGQNLIGWGGFAGFHFLTPDGKLARYDASRFTGLRFWVRGSTKPDAAKSLRVEITTASQVDKLYGGDCVPTAVLHCDDYWRAYVPLTERWVFHELPFSHLRQGDWGKRELSLDQRGIVGVNFVARGLADFWLDDVALTPR